MVKVILFDFWGTLVECGVWSPTKQVKQILNIKAPFSEYITRMQKVMMTQDYESLSAAFESLGKEFGFSLREDHMEELVGMWNKSWLLAHPYVETKETLLRLNEKYRVVLVANSDKFSIPKVVEKFELAPYFEKMFFSCEVGCVKNDEGFLSHVLKELNVEAQDCVFVGDSMQSDIEPAQKAGMKAVLVDRKDTRDFDPKVLSLRNIELHL